MGSTPTVSMGIWLTGQILKFKDNHKKKRGMRVPLLFYGLILHQNGLRAIFIDQLTICPSFASDSITGDSGASFE